MNRKLICVIALVFCLLMLSACGCSHEEWVSSESGEKICAKCEISQCEVNGHTWFAATCEEPKTCENCKLTEGEALGHSWVEATCEEAKNCTTCKSVEGKALGHSWIDATTERPKHCETCSKSEGGRIITDPRFKTANCSALFGKWEGIVTVSGNDFQDGFSKYLKEFSCIYILDFSNDGNLTISFSPENQEVFKDAMVKYTKDSLYKEFAAAGFGKGAVDEYILETFGVSTEEYVRGELDKVGIKEIFAALELSLTYYVQNEKLYSGLGWNLMDEGEEFSVEGDILNYMIDGEFVEFTKKK